MQAKQVYSPHNWPLLNLKWARYSINYHWMWINLTRRLRSRTAMIRSFSHFPRKGWHRNMQLWSQNYWGKRSQIELRVPLGFGLRWWRFQREIGSVDCLQNIRRDRGRLHQPWGSRPRHLQGHQLRRQPMYHQHYSRSRTQPVRPVLVRVFAGGAGGWGLHVL